MDPSVKTTIEQRLLETGEKERLKEHLRNRLIESGWREELKLHAKEVRQKLSKKNQHQSKFIVEYMHSHGKVSRRFLFFTLTFLFCVFFQNPWV